MVKSDNESLAVLEARIRSAPTKYVALATGTMLSFTELTSISAPGYARVAVTYGTAAAMEDDGLGTILATLRNSAIAVFAANSGAGPWPALNLMLLFDALTGGSHIRRALLQDQTIIILPGQSFRYPVGALVHTEQ